MKIALVGSSGYIATYLLERFEKEGYIDDILKIDQAPGADLYLDLLHPEKFDYDYLKEIDFIIFTAAISEPDKCAEDFELCWSINVVGTRYFIENAINAGCRVLFFSSDAVFGDITGHIYTEESETKANTPYGRMKKEIEDAFRKETNFKAIRLSYVVSAQDKYVSYCLNCLRMEKIAEVFHPFYRNCISVKDVVDTVSWFLLNWSNYKHCFLNVAGKELISRVRIADEINRYLKKQLKYIIVTPDEKFYKNRPEITQMVSLYMKEYQIIQDNTFSEKIKTELENIRI